MHSDKGNGHTDLRVLRAQVPKEIAPAIRVSIAKADSIVCNLIRAVYEGAHVEDAKKSWTEKQTSACLFGAARDDLRRGDGMKTHLVSDFHKPQIEGLGVAQ